MLSKTDTYLPKCLAAGAQVIGGPEEYRLLSAKWWIPRHRALEGVQPLVCVVEVSHSHAAHVYR